MEALVRLAEQIEAISVILQDLGSELYARAFRNKGIAALTIGQFRYLEIIARRPGITSTELAELFGVKKPTVAQITAVLAARGLIMKKTSAEDGRKSRLSVTRTTRDIFAFRNGMYRRFAERVGEILTARQRRAYEQLNELVLRAYRQDTAKG
jgi:DNA-binding MarR family transcriptional regulator